MDEYTWDGKSGPGASSSALADLEDVIPLVGLLQTGDESEKQTALMALKSLAIDHQQVIYCPPHSSTRLRASVFFNKDTDLENAPKKCCFCDMPSWQFQP